MSPDPNTLGVKFIVDVVIATPNCNGPKAGDLLSGLFPPLIFAGTLTYATLFGCTENLEMVAAGADKDTAPGDSGGPAYVLANDGLLYLAGITSRGISISTTSGPGGIYVLAASAPIREFLIANGVPAESFAD